MKMRKKSINGGNETQKTARQAYQRGNQRESSPHYVFLYPEQSEDEEEQAFPLKARNFSQTSPRKVEVINVQVNSEDTLQALALRYRCTISELKRINNIHKDNEIHAHRSIKVPVQPYSLLTESIGQNNESQLNKTSSVRNETEETAPKENQPIDLLAVSSQSMSSSVEINSIILNSTVEPLSQFNNESSQCLDDNDETDQLLSSTGSHQLNSSNNIVNTFKCSGADWGLSITQLLCVSLLLGFAGPIIYILYIAESKHSSP